MSTTSAFTSTTYDNHTDTMATSNNATATTANVHVASTAVAIKAEDVNPHTDLVGIPTPVKEEAVTHKKKYLVPNIEKIIDSNFNLLLIGLHGTGKTQTILDVCQDKGLKLKSYSCATLDPYTDLVGVPVPADDATAIGEKVLKMIRPKDIDEADIVFFDELNRARPEVQNAVLEIINNRSINGEKLPNLKCCVAAINPPDKNYKVTDLDVALMDRFHIYHDMKPRVSSEYMKNVLKDKTAVTLEKWWNAIDIGKRDTYISPRRLMLIGQVFDALGDKRSFKAAFPPGSKNDTEKLWQMLTAADADVHATNGVSKSNYFSYELTPFNLKKNKIQIAEELSKNPEAADLHNDVMNAFLNMSLSPAKMTDDYLPIFNAMRTPNVETLMSKKSNAWRSQFRAHFERQWGANGDVWAMERANLHKVINGLTIHHSSKIRDLPTAVTVTPAAAATVPTALSTVGISADSNSFGDSKGIFHTITNTVADLIKNDDQKNVSIDDTSEDIPF